ncbi:XrtA/PEP-CTERM system TPR-repeat protein PrsT [Massilia sp. PWRC2]|uniref:XrtA/PEP-CTERM system TPR-repeat protein PrsT n=1 Tax=Massilia sp. PWRC2 TaxID=2804626 RepID=UPI003CEDEA3A
MPYFVSQRAIHASFLVSALVLSAGMTACSKTETAASLMSEAQQYESKGDVKAALIQLKNAVAKAPDDAEVRLRLASFYLRNNDPVSAEKEARKASELKADAVRTMPLLARALVSQGEGQKALDETSLLEASSNADLLSARGDAYLTLGKNDKASESYQRALTSQPGQADALLGLARLAAIGKDFDKADQLTTQAAAANPKNADVFMFKGNLMRAQNKSPEALAAFSQAITIKPDMVPARIERANLELAAKQYDLAKVDIDAARKAAPGALPPLYAQALLDFSQGKYPAANESIQKVLSKAPTHLPSMLLAGAIELNLGSYKLAEQHLTSYLNGNPGNDYARKLLAQTQLRSAQPDSAGATLAPLLKNGGSDAQTLALAGESALRSRDYGKATEYLEKAAALEPTSSSLRTSLGLSKLAQGNSSDGISELEKASALDPKSEQASVALVRSELQLKNYDKALVAVKAALVAHPDSVNLRTLEGGTYLSKRDLVAARVSFDKAATGHPAQFGPVMSLAQIDVAEKKPDAARARLLAYAEKNKGANAPLALAALAISQKNTAEATTWMEKAVADNPDDLGAGTQLIGHYLGTKQAPKALILARKLQAANPSKPELLDALGQAQLASNDDAGALDSYSKLTGLLPRSAMAQLRLAAVHLRLKNEAAAAEDVKKALTFEPNNERAQLAQIEMAMAGNKPELALTLARTMQKSSPKLPLGYAIEGEILMRQKKFDGATHAFEQAHGLANNSGSLIKTANALQAAGKNKDAEAKLQSWLASHANDPAVTMYLGELLMLRKDYKGASTRFEALLKTAPNDALVLNNLAWAYQQQKDPRALATAEAAVKAAPESGAVVDTLGWMLVEQDNVARALPLLQKAVTLSPNSPELGYHLAAALAKSGDKAGARKALDKVLASPTPFAQIEEARALSKSL